MTRKDIQNVSRSEDWVVPFLHCKPDCAGWCVKIYQNPGYFFYRKYLLYTLLEKRRLEIIELALFCSVFTLSRARKNKCLL
jgi:hypothetical protein